MIRQIYIEFWVLFMGVFIRINISVRTRFSIIYRILWNYCYAEPKGIEQCKKFNKKFHRIEMISSSE